ncbi:acetylornithine deacetylase [Flavobacteriaceae bacterium 3-367]
MKREHRDIQKTIAILKDLVAFSVLGGDSNLSIAGYIIDYLEENQISFHKVMNDRGNKMSVHCRIGPARDGGVVLSGHMDVVTTEGQHWTRPEFTLTREEGRLYGRGTTDMKGFLACCLAMVPTLKKKTLVKPIYFAFSYDEEIGCLAGPDLIRDMKRAYAERPAFAIIGEPTSMRTITAEKGVAFFETEVVSTAAHSSQVRNSLSAIEETTYLIQWLLKKMDDFINEGNVDPRFDPSHTTIHIGKIRGGTATNIVADHCLFEWDIRNIPKDSIEKIKESFEVFCMQRIAKNKTVFPDFNIRTTANFPIVPGLDTPLNEEIVALVNGLTHSKAPGTVAFASEAGQFSKEGFETVLCGPGDMEQGHTADEYIEVTQLNTCLYFLDRLADWAKMEHKHEQKNEKV